MEQPTTITPSTRRGWLRTSVFAIAGIYFLYLHSQTRELSFLISAIGFALILPNTFLHPVNWRSPIKSTGSRPHPGLTLLSFTGTILILVGLVMQWR